MNLHTIINSVFQSKTYILSTSLNKEAWLIDCGDSQPIIDYIEINKLKLKGVLLTHTHFDHIYGLNDIVNYFPEVTIYTSEEGKKGLYDEIQNLSKFNENPWTFNSNNANVLTEQSELYVLDRSIEIYFTPGHDISCLSYLIDNYFFSGDSYIPGLKTYTNWPLSEKRDAKMSEEKILKMAKVKNLQIKAGH